MSAKDDGEGGNFDCARHACWNDPWIGDLAGLFDAAPPLVAAISRCRLGNFPVTADADLGGIVNLVGPDPLVWGSTWIDRFGTFRLIPVRRDGIDCFVDNKPPGPGGGEGMGGAI
jgi:hypothetical protein